MGTATAEKDPGSTELELEWRDVKPGDIIVRHVDVGPGAWMKVVVRRQVRPLPTVPDTLIDVDWLSPVAWGRDGVFRLEAETGQWLSRRLQFGPAQLQAEIRDHVVLAQPRHVTIEEVLDESGGWFTDTQRRLIREWLGVQP